METVDQTHPSPAQLEVEPPEPWVGEHLERCPRCRVDRRMLRAASEPAPEAVRQSVRSTLDTLGAALTLSWCSSRAESLVDGGDSSTRTGPDVVLAAGTRVGHFTVEGLLGRGGMAVVYLVRHRDLHTLHALKLLHLSSASLHERVQREARLQARLHHPNVLAVQEALHVNGVPALVLDRANGPALDAVLRHERLGIADADSLARQVLAGVGAAHTLGLVHRDLKPANILLDIDADEGLIRARVSDFGLAKALDMGTGSTVQTRTGAVMGTPSYMAPEQLRDASRADRRSDVFALGAVLFELLTGFRCFGGTDFVDVVRRVSQGLHPDLESLRPGLPGRMLQAVEAALQPAPEDRPEDADALRALWIGDDPPVPEWRDPALAARLLDLVEVLPLPESPGAPRELSTDQGARTQRVAPHGAPPEDAPFIGRLSALAELDALVRPGSLVTLTGAGGMGKTRLAQRLAWTRANRFPGGAWFVSAVGARTEGELARAVAHTLGLVPETDVVAQVGRVLRDKGRALLLVDNLEQVVETADALLTRWRTGAPELSVVATSRVRLRAPGEQVLSLEPMSAEEGSELFLQRARAHRPELELDDADRARLQSLVAQLDGLPLALELAASRLRFLSLEDLVQRLDQRFRVLAGGRDRHATLRMVLEDSWSLLEPWEQASLAQCSAFRDGFTLEAAEAVVDLSPWPEAPWVLDVLQALDDASLLDTRKDATQPGARPRLHLLVSVQAFAAEKLEASGAVGEVQARHSAHYTRLGEEAARRARRSASGRPLRLALMAELENVLHATREAIELGEGHAAVLGLGAATEVLFELGPLALAAELGEAVLALTELLPADRVDALMLTAEANERMGRIDRATTCLARALDLATTPRDRARALVDLGSIDIQQGRTAPAESRLEEGLALALDSEDPFLQARAWICTGELHYARSRIERALEAIEKAAAIAEAADDDVRQSEILQHRGLLLGLLGDRAGGEAAYQALWERARREHDRNTQMIALHGNAVSALRNKDPISAIPLLRRALRIAEQAGHAVRIASYSSDLGWAYADSGRMEEALAAYARSCATWRELGRQGNLAVALRNHATVYCEEGRLGPARELLEEALPISVEGGHVLAEAATRCTLGDIARAEGRHEDAIRQFEAARPLAAQANAHLLASVLKGLAASHELLGELDRALEVHDAHVDHAKELEADLGAPLAARAHVHMDLGQLDEADADLEAAITAARTPSTRALAWSMRALWCAHRGDEGGVDRALERAEIEADRSDARDRALVLCVRGATCQLLGRPEADRWFEEGLEICPEPLRQVELEALRERTKPAP